MTPIIILFFDSVKVRQKLTNMEIEMDHLVLDGMNIVGSPPGSPSVASSSEQVNV
jgi:hypothetical protein